MDDLGFIKATLDDLDERLAKRTAYDTIRAMGIVRQLLVDDTPLVHTLQQITRNRVEFTVGTSTAVPSNLPEPVFWELADGVDPEGARPGAGSVSLPLDKLLKHPVGGQRGTTTTVRDIVRAGANIWGGVHRGKAKTEDGKILLEVQQQLNIGRAPAYVRAMNATGRVVSRALREAIARYEAGAQFGNEAPAGRSVSERPD